MVDDDRAFEIGVCKGQPSQRRRWKKIVSGCVLTNDLHEQDGVREASKTHKLYSWPTIVSGFACDYALTFQASQGARSIVAEAGKLASSQMLSNVISGRDAQSRREDDVFKDGVDTQLDRRRVRL